MNPQRKGQEPLEEEIRREQAAVLARAGERLREALEKLAALDGKIRTALAGPQASAREINSLIAAYNGQRQEAELRYYYLIVTREALGLVHHHRLEEFYRLPPVRRYLREP